MWLFELGLYYTISWYSMFFDSILLNDCFQLHWKAPMKEIVCDAILSLNPLFFFSISVCVSFLCKLYLCELVKFYKPVEMQLWNELSEKIWKICS